MNQRIIRLAAGTCLAAAAGLGLAGCSLLPGGTTTQATSDTGSSNGSGSNGSGSNGSGTTTTMGSDSGSSNGSGSTSGADAGSTENVFDIHEGDCLNLPDSSADSVTDVTVVPCEQSHQYEIYAEVIMTGDTYPGDTAVESQGTDQCGSRFDSWVADSSKFDYTFMPPSQESWEQVNDRTILCMAMPLSGDTSTGSAGK